MKLRLVALGAICALALAYSCGTKNSLEILKRNFSDEIERQQNIVLSFDRALVPDSLTGKWDSTAYLRFSPEIKGRFKWNSPTELVFSPGHQFLPSSNYKVELTDKLLANFAGKSLALPDQKTLEFHTPYLKMLGGDVFWAQSSKNAGAIEVRANLKFNYAVNPFEVAKLLRAFVGSDEVKVNVATSLVGEIIPVSIEDISRFGSEDTPVRFVIDKGLKCVESEWQSPNAFELQSEVPSRTRFDVKSMYTEFDETEGVVHIHTTQTPDANNLKEFIGIKPEVKFTVEAKEYGIMLKGDFKTNQNYEITVRQHLRGLFGGVLEKEYSQFVGFGELEPRISFVSGKGIYLCAKGEKNVAIRIINVPKVRVTIAKIYENNIVPFTREGRRHRYWGDESDDGYRLGEYSYFEYKDYGDIISERDYDTRSLPKQDGVNILNLNFDDINGYRGIFAVRVSSAEDLWLRDARIVSITDIGLIAKQNDDEIFVFANSILDTKPLADVNLQLVSSNNQFVMKATTNSDGVAVFSNVKSKAPGFKISMITARHGTDFNYLHFSDTKVETSRFEVGGLRENPSGYQAFIYAERDIYRPGETIHLNTVVRDDAWNPAGKIPIKLKVLLPNGREFFGIKGMLNEQGAFETEIPVPASSVTGVYTVEAYSANDVLLNTKSLNIEEFIPDRIKVSMRLESGEITAPGRVSATVNAVNLFGPPAANRNYQMDFSLARKEFLPKNYRRYTFAINSKSQISFEKILREGKTDAQGNAAQSFEIPAAYSDIGILQGKLYATVFDESGRPVNQLERFEVMTQSVFYGIGIFDRYVGTRKQVEIPLLAVDKSGKAISANAKIQVVKLNYQTVIEKSEWGGFRYLSQKQEQIISEREITISGEHSTFGFIPPASGEYEVRLMKPGVQNYVAYYFYAYRWGDTQSSSFEVNREGQVEIEFDKDSYEVGEKANILFKTPFVGKMLVTVERGSVLKHFYVETDKKSATLTLPITEDFLPNCYISATLFKPIDDGSIPLTIAHGYEPLRVEKSANKLPVSIVATERSRSQSKLTVTAKTAPNAELTIAVVDEGILQIKNQKTPDIFGWFYQKRALGVLSFDVYPFLFPEIKLRKFASGGDGYDLSKRVNPLTSRRAKLVSYWSGILKANGSGEAKFTVDIPQFSGDLRVMAISYKNKAFGSAEKHVKISDPIVVSSGLPRFMSPRDTVEMPVMIANTTGKTAQVSAKIGIKGALFVVGSDKQSVTIQPNAEQQVNFKIVAKNEIGLGEVLVEVNGLGENFSDKTEIAVRPITSLLKTSGAGTVKPNERQTLDLQANYVKSSIAAKLVVSRSPIAQFTDNLAELVEYPYGCLEQTVSIAFVQMYFEDLSRALLNRKSVSSNPFYNVQEAIRKAESMQTYNGGLSLWQGEEQEHWWASAYAAHFLTEAKKAGFNVNPVVFDKLLNYLAKKAKERTTVNYRFYPVSLRTEQSRQVTPRETIYSLYVLALNGRQDLASMNYFKERTAELTADSRYLLASAFMLAGESQSYRAVLPQSFGNEESLSDFGGSFASALRDQALTLNTLFDVDPQNIQIPQMVQHLSREFARKKYHSTQENVFTLLALGKFARQNIGKSASGRISTEGKQIAKFEEKDLLLKDGIAGKQVVVENTGEGNLYYFWSIEGLSAEGTFKQEDNFLKVRKQFFNRWGQPIDLRSLKQNDVVVVKISAIAANGATVENSVITDMLPAGLEIENPRITASAEFAWIKDNALSAATDVGEESEEEGEGDIVRTRPKQRGQRYAVHFDIRDDRINIFTTISGKESNYYYVTRAVTKGSFRMGPVSADAMYNGEYHSYNGAGTVKIE